MADHHERAAEPRAQACGEEGAAHGERDAVDQRLAHAQKARRQRALDDCAELPVPEPACLEVDGQRRADLPGARHGQGGVERDVAELLELHRVERDDAVVHAAGHERQEHGRCHEPRDRPHPDVLRQAHRAQGPCDTARHVAEDGHDDQDVGHHADEHGQERREHDVEVGGHLLAQALLDGAHDEDAEDDGQHAALAGYQHRVERHVVVVEAQGAGYLVDARQGGDHAEHAAQDGRAAEALGRPVARPGGDVGHERDVDQDEHPVEQVPADDVGIVGNELGEQGREPRAQAGDDDAGDERHEDVGEHLQRPFEAAAPLGLCGGGLVRLPVGVARHTCRKAHLAAQVRAFLARAGAHHDLVAGGPVVHDAHDARHGPEPRLVDVGLVAHGQAQARHAVGDAGDVARPSELGDDLLDGLACVHGESSGVFAGPRGGCRRGCDSRRGIISIVGRIRRPTPRAAARSGPGRGRPHYGSCCHRHRCLRDQWHGRRQARSIMAAGGHSQNKDFPYVVSGPAEPKTACRNRGRCPGPRLPGRAPHSRTRSFCNGRRTCQAT